MPRDTIEKIEKDLEDRMIGRCKVLYGELHIRILIQIAKELRVLAQRSE